MARGEQSCRQRPCRSATCRFRIEDEKNICTRSAVKGGGSGRRGPRIPRHAGGRDARHGGDELRESVPRKRPELRDAEVIWSGSRRKYCCAGREDGVVKRHATRCGCDRRSSRQDQQQNRRHTQLLDAPLADSLTAETTPCTPLADAVNASSRRVRGSAACADGRGPPVEAPGGTLAPESRTDVAALTGVPVDHCMCSEERAVSAQATCCSPSLPEAAPP